MRREMSSDSEDSYIWELSNSHHKKKECRRRRIECLNCIKCLWHQHDVTDKVTWYFDRAIQIPFFETKWPNFKAHKIETSQTLKSCISNNIFFNRTEKEFVSYEL